MPSHPQRSAAPNQIRIIGGRWRSRIVRFPHSKGVRPTPDRVRETLFNWLGQDLSELSILDLFAGSGALSLESLSRGARLAVAVDESAGVISALRRNADLLGANGLELHHSDALRHLAAEHRRFDVIFVDPPFGEDWMRKLWPKLPDRLNGGAVVYVEQSRQVEPPQGWSVERHQAAGSVHYHLLRYESALSTPDVVNQRRTS